ncbi:MAG: xanthine dehydrogenase family protein subunit M [Candidatus Hydrogenedentota bacterium]|nr:MAG: xanthine dehydrogenase family protein subunit M [Candidatus Hydrogenedentota bacterium]
MPEASLLDFSVFNPRRLDEALSLLAEEENVVPLAGGTDLMVTLETGNLSPCRFLNLMGIAEFQEPFSWCDGKLRMSPLCSYRDTRIDKDVATRYPLLVRAAREVGVLAIQSRGTWAGNIVNASPAADGVPVLMVYDAEVELRSTSGTRTVPLCDFYRGYKEMDRASDELVTGIILPPPPEDRIEYFRKVAPRRLQAITKVLLTGYLLRSDDRIEDCRIVLGSVAPFTLRARETESILRGSVLDSETIKAARAALQGEISPIDDIRSTAMYRRNVAERLLDEFLLSASPESH